MLKKSTSVEGWLIRMPRLRHLKHARPWAYTLLFTPVSETETGEE